MQSILGNKRKQSDSTDGSIKTITSSDFIIDLHSSNSNVGLVCMISAGANDITATRIASNLVSKFPSLRVTYSTGSKTDSWSLDSISTSGFAFEVGPVTHGIIDYHLLEQTRDLVCTTLDYIENRNNCLLENIHEEEKSTIEIIKNSNSYNENVNSKIPEYNFLSKKIEVYIMETYIHFPLRNCCLHPNLLNKDFSIIKPGDDCFITTDCTKTKIPFIYHIELNKDSKDSNSNNSKEIPIEEQKELYVVFVNEAAYAKRNIAFAVYTKHQKTVF